MYIVRGDIAVYDEKEVEDSLEFLNQLDIYKKCRADNIIDIMGLRETIRCDDIAQYSGYAEDTQRIDNTYYPEKNDGIPEVIQKEKTKTKTGWNIADFIFIAGCIVISVVLSYAFTHYIAHHTKVEGSSMNDTLNNGDYLIVEKVSYYGHDPERYDIVVFPYSENVNYIKRIIGMPGEKIQIIDGKVYINDAQLTDDIYGRESIADPGVAQEPVYLSDDEYFVMGDNRNSSIDSRSKSVGAVKKDKIEGKAVYRLWPFSDFGAID